MFDSPNLKYDIQPVAGHYAVYINNSFYCTADTYSEAREEVLNYARELENSLKGGRRCDS